MKNIQKLLETIQNDWGENWDQVVDFFGEETANLLDEAIKEADKINHDTPDNHSLKMEIADDIAESHLEWLKSEGIINHLHTINDEKEVRYTEEAQEIFNQFYDNHLEILNKYL